MRKDDLVGQRFGRLVVQRAGVSSHAGRQWICLCDCGKECMPFGFGLKNGTTTSCGCYNKELVGALRRTHGDTGTPEHEAWMAMRQRCENPNSTNYKNYGAKGVTVCARWSWYANFLEDMGR